MIVSGDVTPDHYTVSKNDVKIIQKEIKKQEWKLVRKAGAHGKGDNVKVDLTPQEQASQKISDEDIISLAKIGKTLEEHYNFPQDIEWAKEDGQIFIVQTRPVTTIKGGPRRRPRYRRPGARLRGAGQPGRGLRPGQDRARPVADRQGARGGHPGRRDDHAGLRPGDEARRRHRHRPRRADGPRRHRQP